MNRLQSEIRWSAIGRVGALTLSIAAGVFATANAQPSLATLNGGPSGATPPTANNSPVISLRYPREVVDTSIVDIDPVAGGNQIVLPNNLANNSRSIQEQGVTTSGIRNRSRAVLNAGNVNANSELRFVGTLGFAGEAAHSFIVFLRSSDLPSIGTSLATLLTKVGTGAAAGDNTIPYAKYMLNTAGTFNLANAALTDASFNTGNGVALLSSALDGANADFVSAAPNVISPVLAWRNGGFDIAVLVINDLATAGAGGQNLASEYIWVKNPQQSVAPASAATTVNGSGNITQLAILANTQLQDDSTANPADTNAITTGDIYVQPGGSGPTQSLTTYLGTLNGPPVAGGITIGGTSNADYKRIITVPFTTNILAANVGAVQTSRVGFNALSNVFGVSGENPNANVASYVLMGPAAPITVSGTRLLQASGPVANSAASEIWVEVTASSTISTIGDNNQFLLTNAAGKIIARSNLVQFAVPGAGAVPGINDTNLDGTTTDPVATADPTRVFARFQLGQFNNNDPTQAFTSRPNDAINSDATYTSNGASTIRNRVNRSALSIIRNSAAVNFLQSSIGGNLSSTTNVALTSAARPLPIAFQTRANGNVAGISNPQAAFVDQIAVVFDSTVSSPTQNRFTVGYNPGVIISDLTAGLRSDLSIPRATTASASTFTSRVQSLSGFGPATTNVTNDTVVFNSTLLPLTANAANGTAAATGIRPGTGFPTGNSPYFAALDNVAVVANSLGNVITSGATFTSGALTNFTTPTTTGLVADGAPPALMSAVSQVVDGNGNTTTVRVGFSELAQQINAPVVAVAAGAGDGSNEQTNEAESYFSINDKTSAMNRFLLTNLSNGNYATVNFGIGSDDNQVDIDLDNSPTGFLDKTVTAGYEIRVFNPGFPIDDDNGNLIDPTVSRTRAVMITPPGVQFAPLGEPVGRAFVDGSQKVITIQLKTTQQVALNSGGTTASLLNRFFVRGGAPFDFGQTGTPLTIPGQFSNISFSTTAGTDGLFPMTLTFTANTPFLQEDFTIEYADRTNTGYLTQSDAYLVGAGSAGGEVPGAIIPVRVVRPAKQAAGGDPLGMTIIGNVNLGAGNDSNGTTIKAFLYSPVRGNANVSFVYKGITYTGTIAAFGGPNDTELLFDGAVFYFHPQLRGTGGNGTLAPQGVLNSTPDLDLGAYFDYSQVEPQGGGNGVVTTQRKKFVYENINSLSNVVQPIALTLRRDTTNPNRMTITGTGISNGFLTFRGSFLVDGDPIGTAVVTGPADPVTGARPYTLHTIGNKAWAGRNIIIVVCPDPFLTPGVRNFMANNFLVNRLTFRSDFTTAGSNAGPARFDINSANVVEFRLNDYVNNGWAILPVVTTNGGNDFAAAGFDPARVGTLTTPTTFTPVNTLVPFPANTTAFGYFILFDPSDCVPVLVDVTTALAIDNRGVYCGSVFGLNRIVSGYSYAIEFASSVSGYSWFQFGGRLSAIGSASNPATLRTVTNSANGGWNLIANMRNAVVSANAFPGSSTDAAGIVIGMNNRDGVRIGGAAFTGANANFADLTSIGINNGALTNQLQATINSRAQ